MEITLLRLLTEQLSLVLMLIALYLFVSKDELKRRDFLTIGIVLTLCFFVRASSIIYPAAFFLAYIFSKSKFRLASFLMFLLPLAVAGLFALFVFSRYGVLFPQYPKAFDHYYAATFITGGSFFENVPVIRPAFNVFQSMIGINFNDMQRVLFCILRVLGFFMLLRLPAVFKYRKKDELVLFILPALIIISTLLLYKNFIVAEFQWTRFLLLPVICFLALGAFGLREISKAFLPKTHKMLFHIIMLVVFASNFYQSWKVLEVYWKKDEAKERVFMLQAVKDWADKNVGKDDQVAVSLFLLGRVYLERPTVILPLYKALNFNNLDKFLSIYKPKALIFENTLSAQFEDNLLKLGYKRAIQRPLADVFWVYVPAALSK